MSKFIKDGKVAVLISPGFGAGFSTWDYGGDYPEIIFDPLIVEILLGNKKNKTESICDYIEKNYPGFCTLGVEDLVVEWIDVGAKFRIDEYDGCESLIIENENSWIVA